MMWDVLGSWAFVALVVLVAGGLLVAALRRTQASRRSAAAFLVGYAVASTALVAFLVTPASASGTQCSTAALDNVNAAALDQATADELAAQGLGDRVADCRANARLRYLVGMGLVVGATATALVVLRTRRPVPVHQQS